MLEVNKIYLGDCLELMKEIPDKSVDCVLTDPPYGRKRSKGMSLKGGLAPRNVYEGDWDLSIPDQRYFDEMFRISKNQIIFGGHLFDLPKTNAWLVWDKTGYLNMDSIIGHCELIWTSFRIPIKKYAYIQQGFIKQTEDKYYHPTQKPVELICMILKDFSNEGQLILDPFLGSGTTAVACKELKRQYIGIEKEEQYYKIAQRRIDEVNNLL